MRITKIMTTTYDSEHLSILIDGKRKFSVGSSYDTPEDNTLSRNFSDCYSITTLLAEAYEAGKNGEELIIENEVQ